MTEHPIINAASAAVFKEGQVLIIKRGAGDNRALWSLPGGHIHPREKPEDAATREVYEETGVKMNIIGHAEELPVDTGAALYRIQVYAAVWCSGEAKASSDAAAARWINPEDLKELLTTPDLHRIVLKAQKLLDV